MKTREEVEALKKNWESDPNWDLHKTEGFEEFHDELQAFEEARRRSWCEELTAGVHVLAMKLDCSFDLAQFILELEGRLQELEKRLNSVEAEAAHLKDVLRRAVEAAHLKDVLRRGM